MSLKLRLIAATPISALSCILAASTAGDAKADGLLAPIWTGAYAGVHGGANWLEVDTSDGVATETQNAIFGAHVGINLGLGLIVAGVEADLNYAGTSSRVDLGSGVTGKVEIDGSGSIRGRVGLPIGPALIYATAGYAWMDVGATISGGTTSEIERSSAFKGIVYGGGIEAYVLPKMTVRLEALQYDYDTDAFSFGALGSTATAFDPSATVVRAGISFRFN